MDSILTSIKLLLGITEEDTSFDGVLIIHINSVFSILTQMGVGPAAGFSIEDDSAIWSDYISTNAKLSLVKSYIFMKVKLIFDPPTSSAAMEAMNRLISESEFRLNVTVDPGTSAT